MTYDANILILLRVVLASLKYHLFYYYLTYNVNYGVYVTQKNDDEKTEMNNNRDYQ